MTDSLMRNLNVQAIAHLPIWLIMAAQVHAPSKVVLVGAGNGTGPLVQSLVGLKSSPLHVNMQVQLIEVDPLVISQLAKKLSPKSAWVLSQKVVVPDQTSINTNLNTYFQYSLGAESSLLPPESLKSLWPNIQLRKKESCAKGILLSSLLPASWLMIDCLPAAQLIQGVNLDQVDVLMARVVFYKIEKSPPGSSLFELDEKLSSQGFKLCACFTERNASLGKALWLRDSAKQLELAKPLGKQRAKQLDQEKTEAQNLTQISQSISKIEKDMQESEKRVTRELSKGLTNAVKQIESYMAIQQWAENGSASFDFHGWPISPDLGLFLIEIINSRSFDLIIEFGSGTSTALLAKAVAKQLLIDADKKDTRILSFEHQLNYFEKTSKILKQHGFEEIVELTYAPLVEWRDGDIGYLYYDCQTILESLRQQYQSKSLNILILVDGPPGKTCPNARYPAVPLVFEALSRHRIDLVLDDANRPNEKQTIEMWKAYLEKRSIPVIETAVPSERGIYYGVINELKI